MGGTCDTDANNSEIATAVLTIPQTINTNNLTGKITYKYHNCSSNCYKKCTGTYSYVGSFTDDDGNVHYDVRCNKCGNYQSQFSDLSGQSCTNTVSICGYTNGQIIGATITY